jgi:hypothetical protein
MIELMLHRSTTDAYKYNPLSLDSEGRVSVPTGAGFEVKSQDRIGKQALRIEQTGEQMQR